MTAAARGRAAAVAAALTLLGGAAACSSSSSGGAKHTGSTVLPGDTGGDGGLATPATLPSGGFPKVDHPATTGRLAATRVHPTLVAKADTPLALVARPNHPDQLFVALRAGQVLLAHPATATRPFRLDTGHPLVDLGHAVGTAGEEGLLGLAFDRTGRTLYLSYNVPANDSRVVAYRVSDDEAPVVDVDHPRVILAVDQPDATNHKGGDLQLGPDGYLYVGYGDGGNQNDPEDNGQNPATMLAKILRIDPSHPADGKPYGIPSDNPYASGRGGLPETFLTGLRNPWRFSFDPATGDLWIGDVGQGTWEEIDRVPAGKGAGANFGWSGLEGTEVFVHDRLPAKSVPPLYEMQHSSGVCAVTGGVVYRGKKIPALQGAYLFSDACHIGLAALRADLPPDAVGTVTDVAWLPGTKAAVQVVSIGTDAANEVYLLGLDGQIWRLDPPT